MVKKIVCLLLILACSLAIVACGNNAATPSGENPPAENPENNPPVDEPEEELPDAAFFELIENSKPTVIDTYTYTEDKSTKKGYEGVYKTTVYSDTSYSFDYSYQKANKVSVETIGQPSILEVSGSVIYENGLYSVDGGETWFSEVPDVDALGIKLDINRDYLGKYSMSKDGKTLTARISPANAEKLLGISEINAKGSVTVRIISNGTYLWKLNVEYENDSASVSIQTTYSYVPVSESAN